MSTTDPVYGTLRRASNYRSFASFSPLPYPSEIGKTRLGLFGCLALLPSEGVPVMYISAKFEIAYLFIPKPDGSGSLHYSQMMLLVDALFLHMDSLSLFLFVAGKCLLAVKSTERREETRRYLWIIPENYRRLVTYVHLCMV
jgi:hypothetical protein